jgi:hypothetical protein
MLTSTAIGRPLGQDMVRTFREELCSVIGIVLLSRSKAGNTPHAATGTLLYGAQRPLELPG